MSELFEPVGEHDWRIATTATGLLADFNAAGVLTSSDVHVADRVGALGGESDERVLLAVALTVRAVRRGSVCLDLSVVRDTAPELAWPDEWPIERSPLVAAGVIRWDHGLLYLYLRGMCGPSTPLVDGAPCGVFAWRPPVALVEDLSDLLDGHHD